MGDPRSCSSELWSSGAEPATVRFVTISVSTEPIVSRFVVRGTPGVSIVAEAWGSEAAMLREWHFDGGGLVRAGTATQPQVEAPIAGHVETRAGAEAMVAAARSLPLTFERRAVALFTYGTPFGLSLCLSTCPGLISIKGPVEEPLVTGTGLGKTVEGTVSTAARDLGAAPDDWTSGSWRKVLYGAPAGDYRFGIEAAFGAAATQYGYNYGIEPYVLLVVADADFPACTASPQVSSGADGHPICGDAAP